MRGGLWTRAASGCECGFDRRAKVDHLAARRPEARLHQEMALLLRRRVEQDVRDAFGWQIEFDVLRVAVRRAHLPVLELVAAFRVGLNQADDVMLADESEAAGGELCGGAGSPEVDPTTSVRL